ncbi:dTDP-4-keto-6-deoxy-D-glucose epimerase [Actinobacteria bacterium YIM 96077]|uniref:dTDP-4-dehydrorhamnose 3,5-epimerase n=1 Tax=Phytoactinopolyspora halophila TaxID=1981511 RepID=A0A329QKW4_9ACTN|nr:dTDP-4-dehydrorhamnose 3,5-epimerase [Phytoactinopolyspora halophila]AYY12424.1 dTDP-4-keto-6-deoxy-D-glucose epimerase [Actinobacteria bacterium YIM 96077]RAW12052.1 dTDP-4-dehydrorhamnose 3,5-epimerase [Phytoactinopolyspora halophila]
MEARKLTVPYTYAFTDHLIREKRGASIDFYRHDSFAKAIGYPLPIAHISHTVSKRGTVRGLHFTDTPPGKSKYLYCPRGALLNMIVDLRIGSPIYGRYDVIRLDQDAIRGVFLPGGVGHAYIALADKTVLVEMCSTDDPDIEHTIYPLDPDLELPWPSAIEPILSEKEMNAPKLAEYEVPAKLPFYEEWVEYYESFLK